MRLLSLLLFLVCRITVLMCVGVCGVFLYIDFDGQRIWLCACTVFCVYANFFYATFPVKYIYFRPAVLPFWGYRHEFCIFHSCNAICWFTCQNYSITTHLMNQNIRFDRIDLWERVSFIWKIEILIEIYSKNGPLIVKPLKDFRCWTLSNSPLQCRWTHFHEAEKTIIFIRYLTCFQIIISSS